MPGGRRILEARVLIVDDEKPNVLLLEKMLKNAGYSSVRSTTDPREVPDIYREFRPDLVLLDLKMPHLDGFEVMRRLGEIEPDSYLPVLVLTAQPDRETRLHALEAGAKDFLAKPFDMVEALTRIRNMLEVRLLHDAMRDHNEVLEEKVRERTQEIQVTQLDTVNRLASVAEYRDDETGAHIARVSRLCALLGRACGMSESECEVLLNASKMHDLGKVKIPDRILLKPAKLEPDEWEVMKTHAAVGAELLSESRSGLIRVAETIALTHHERWDGSGYPNGLKGEEIPLVGRICALCDVFDALISERPYKRALPVEEARAEIERSSGTHFDPNLVALFLEILPNAPGAGDLDTNAAQHQPSESEAPS